MKYFDVETWTRVLHAIRRNPTGLRHRLLELTLLGVFPPWAGANALWMELDRLLTPTLRTPEVQPPVFVVGNARSGTTLFHRLLCYDDTHFYHFKTWELFFPSYQQKRLLRALGTLLEKLTGMSLQAWLTRKQDVHLKGLRDMHPIGLDAPEEDEFLMLIPFATNVLAVFFPYGDQLSYLDHFDQRPDARRREIMDYYRACISRQAHHYGVHKRLVSKNPTFVPKLRSLHAEFPDARFIYLIRDPREAMPSLLKMLQNVWRQMGVQESRIQAALAYIAASCVDTYEYALEVLPTFSDKAWCVVDYRDLVADPQATVEKVYKHFGWEITPEYRAILERERTRARRHSSSHTYGLEEFGIDAAQLEERLQPVMKRFGYSSE